MGQDVDPAAGTGPDFRTDRVHINKAVVTMGRTQTGSLAAGTQNVLDADRPPPITQCMDTTPAHAHARAHACAPTSPKLCSAVLTHTWNLLPSAASSTHSACGSTCPSMPGWPEAVCAATAAAAAAACCAVLCWPPSLGGWGPKRRGRHTSGAAALKGWLRALCSNQLE